jgi:hypothetical protein
MLFSVSSSGWPRRWLVVVLATALAALATSRPAGSRPLSGQDAPSAPGHGAPRTLSHDETLKWVAEHRAWRRARKTRPIWARVVAPEEVNREFQTADGAKEVARAGYWLCAGVAGEPWFQAHDRLEARYEPKGAEVRQFAFDPQPRTYRLYVPKSSVRSWAAQVTGPDIKGFFIRPGYDPDRPLYSLAGGFVVRDDTADPYNDSPRDVWLVQEALFKSTYEFVDAPANR